MPLFHVSELTGATVPNASDPMFTEVYRLFHIAHRGTFVIIHCLALPEMVIYNDLDLVIQGTIQAFDQ